MIVLKCLGSSVLVTNKNSSSKLVQSKMTSLSLNHQYTLSFSYMHPTNLELINSTGLKALVLIRMTLMLQLPFGRSSESIQSVITSLHSSQLDGLVILSKIYQFHLAQLNLPSSSRRLILQLQKHSSIFNSSLSRRRSNLSHNCTKSGRLYTRVRTCCKQA